MFQPVFWTKGHRQPGLLSRLIVANIAQTTPMRRIPRDRLAVYAFAGACLVAYLIAAAR